MDWRSISAGFQCPSALHSFSLDRNDLIADSIRATFASAGSLYAPAYFCLLEHSKADVKPYRELKRARATKGKAKVSVSAKPGWSQEHPTCSEAVNEVSSLLKDEDGRDEFERENVYLDSLIGR